MIPSKNFCQIADNDDDRYAADVAALVHFSAYIAREARRLGLPAAAEKARVMQSELLSALPHN